MNGRWEGRTTRGFATYSEMTVIEAEREARETERETRERDADENMSSIDRAKNCSEDDGKNNIEGKPTN